MGTNYYLRWKKKYEPRDENYSEYSEPLVDVLDNGFVWNKHYYAHKDELNKDYYLELHIGKSSCGWHFALCIYPELSINSLKDWEQLFSNKKNIIVDEYGKLISKEDIVSTITERKNKNFKEFDSREAYEKNYIEEQNKLDGVLGVVRCYRDYDDFLRDNHARRGLNGLLAHNSDYFEGQDTGGTYDLTTDWRFG